MRKQDAALQIQSSVRAIQNPRIYIQLVSEDRDGGVTLRQGQHGDELVAILRPLGPSRHFGRILIGQSRSLQIDGLGGLLSELEGVSLLVFGPARTIPQKPKSAFMPEAHFVLV